ncbi:hypothetical protein GX51_04610 [Blastomyces parvus]|uniref:Uncharacterized protein n=1 Tax=Blastomyces parvus TaxID=2060905 RepID=A0A2B7X138_9EURO|nr:hypothetical protein GX51_04610 [Blastomyces parvus]
MSPQNDEVSQPNNFKSISKDAFMEATVGRDTFGIPPRDDLLKPAETMEMDGVVESGHYGWEDIGLKDTIFETINDEDSLFNMSFNPPLTAEERYRQACLNTLYREPSPVTIVIDLTLERDTNHAQPVDTTGRMNGTKIQVPFLQSFPRESHLSKSPPKKAGQQKNNSRRRNSPNRSPNGKISQQSQQLGSRPNEGRIKKQYTRIYKDALTASLKEYRREKLEEDPNAFKHPPEKDATPTKRLSYKKLLQNDNFNSILSNRAGMNPMLHDVHAF